MQSLRLMAGRRNHGSDEGATGEISGSMGVWCGGHLGMGFFFDAHDS